MEALKITLTFASPLLIDSEYPTHMDALIASCVSREAEAMGDDNPWETADDLSGYLDLTELTGEWVWKASMLVFTPVSGIMLQNMTRKSDPDRYHGDLGRLWSGRKPSDSKPLGINPDTFGIDTRSGQQRGYQWLSASKWMEKAEAWVVGDKDAITQLLNVHLTQVGKHGRNGYGRIKSIAVESSAIDESEKWRLRVLPASVPGLEGVEYAPVAACIRAPYWRKTNRVLAGEPLL